MTIDSAAESPRLSIERLAVERGITRPPTLETLPVVDVFDDGEVEEFLEFVAKTRRE